MFLNLIINLSVASGIILAAVICFYNKQLAKSLSSSFNFFYSISLNKWYVDELYVKVFVKPSFYLSDIFWKRGDQKSIDALGPNGISKIINPYWSSAAYLLDSKWILSSLAKTIVANSTLLSFIDLINMWGLTLVGLSLLLGLFSKYGALVGMGFVLLYYLFAPPFIGLEYGKPGEGSYIIVNKNLIEAFALYVLYLFPSSQLIGMDRLFNSSKSN